MRLHGIHLELPFEPAHLLVERLQKLPAAPDYPVLPFSVTATSIRALDNEYRRRINARSTMAFMSTRSVFELTSRQKREDVAEELRRALRLIGNRPRTRALTMTSSDCRFLSASR